MNPFPHFMNFLSVIHILPPLSQSSDNNIPTYWLLVGYEGLPIEAGHRTYNVSQVNFNPTMLKKVELLEAICINGLFVRVH